MFGETSTSDLRAGGLTAEWAKRLGLEPETAVAVGAFDAYMGAVGGGIRAGALVNIMGTSTCDMLVAPPKAVGGACIAGICGQVDGSIIPGMIGLKAGQSAFGDVYAWFKDLLAWPLRSCLNGSRRSAVGQIMKEVEGNILHRLSAEAEKLEPADSSVLALDCLNGRRTPFAD